MPKHLPFILICLLGLTACDRLGNNINALGDNIGKGYDKTRYKMSDYLYSRDAAAPVSTPSYQAAQTAYCYRVQTDTVCYDQPVPRLRNQLVGAQNTGSMAYNDMIEIPADHTAITSESAPLDSVTVGAAPAVAVSDAGTPKPLMSGF